MHGSSCVPVFRRSSTPCSRRKSAFLVSSLVDMKTVRQHFVPFVRTCMYIYFYKCVFACGLASHEVLRISSSGKDSRFFASRQVSGGCGGGSPFRSQLDGSLAHVGFFYLFLSMLHAPEEEEEVGRCRPDWGGVVGDAGSKSSWLSSVISNHSRQGPRHRRSRHSAHGSEREVLRERGAEEVKFFCYRGEPLFGR